MALYSHIGTANKDYWGNKLAHSESYSRRIALNNEELVISLANKIRHHEYEMNSRSFAIIDAVARFFHLFLGPLLTYKPIPAEHRNKIILTGMELQHLHKLCEFDTPEAIRIQENYVMETQILGALLNKARGNIASQR